MTRASRAGSALPRYDADPLVEIRRAVDEELLRRDLRILRHLVGIAPEELEGLMQASELEAVRSSRQDLSRFVVLKRVVEACGWKMEVVATQGERRLHFGSL